MTCASQDILILIPTRDRDADARSRWLPESKALRLEKNNEIDCIITDSEREKDVLVGLLCNINHKWPLCPLLLLITSSFSKSTH